MPVSPVAGFAGAVRVRRLTPTGFSAAEAHGKRQDAISQGRKVRDADPVSTTGLDLALLRLQHIQGCFTPASTTKALHVLVQWPVSLTDGTDAEFMLRWTREFAERVFGPDCVFADRVDRDETSLHVVDLFILPKYTKKTKHTEKLAISTTYHLKKLAVEYGWVGEAPPLQREQGIALQTAWYEFLRDEVGLEQVQRGSRKKQPGDDWLSPEELALVRERERLQEKDKGIQRSTEYIERWAAKVAQNDDKVEAESKKAKEDAEAAAALKRQAQHELIAAQQKRAAADAALAEAAGNGLAAKTAKAKADALAVGLRAWFEGEIIGADVVKRTFTFKDVASRDRLVPLITSDRAQLLELVSGAAQAKRDGDDSRAAAQVAREQADADRIAAANERVAAETDRRAAATDRTRASAELINARSQVAKAEADRTAAAADQEASRAALLAATAERERLHLETLAAQEAKRKAEAFALGVEAFARGELERAEVGPDGVPQLIFQSETARANLFEKLRPAWDTLTAWLVKMTKAIESRLEAVAEMHRRSLEQAVTLADREAAAHRLVTQDDIKKAVQDGMAAHKAAEAVHNRLLWERNRQRGR